MQSISPFGPAKGARHREAPDRVGARDEDQADEGCRSVASEALGTIAVLTRLRRETE
jgi:hypothetical protein